MPINNIALSHLKWVLWQNLTCYLFFVLLYSFFCSCLFETRYSNFPYINVVLWFLIVSFPVYLIWIIPVYAIYNLFLLVLNWGKNFLFYTLLVLSGFLAFQVPEHPWFFQRDFSTYGGYLEWARIECFRIVPQLLTMVLFIVLREIWVKRSLRLN